MQRMVPMILWTLCIAVLPLAAEDARTVWEGVYSDSQADRGREQYSMKCASCHGTNQEGQGAAGALRGSAFLMHWNGHSVDELVSRIWTTMPQDDPGSLSEPSTVDLVAFLLKANAFPSGDHDLPAASEVLKMIKITPKEP